MPCPTKTISLSVSPSLSSISPLASSLRTSSSRICLRPSRLMSGKRELMALSAVSFSNASIRFVSISCNASCFRLQIYKKSSVEMVRWEEKIPVLGWPWPPDAPFALVSERELWRRLPLYGVGVGRGIYIIMCQILS